jgi:hypothetical protein
MLPGVTDPAADAPPATAPSDRLGYLVGVLLLIVGGILLQTPVLNWISGPTIIVVSVVMVGKIQDRLRNRR